MGISGRAESSLFFLENEVESVVRNSAFEIRHSTFWTPNIELRMSNDEGKCRGRLLCRFYKST